MPFDSVVSIGGNRYWTGCGVFYSPRFSPSTIRSRSRYPA